LRLVVDRAELTRISTRVPRDRPVSACHGPVLQAAVRPAEEHPEIHPSHVALAAAVVTAVAVLGASRGASRVGLSNGDPAEAPAEADAVVGISGRAVAVPGRGGRWRCRRLPIAVIRRRGCWDLPVAVAPGGRRRPRVGNHGAAFKPFFAGDVGFTAPWAVVGEDTICRRVPKPVCDAARRREPEAAML